MKKKETYNLSENELVIGSRVKLAYSQHQWVVAAINPHDKIPDINTYTIWLDPIVVLWTNIEK